MRKRRETSQSFAKKNDLPHLTHVTLPRLGATRVILKTLGPQQENGMLGNDAGSSALKGEDVRGPGCTDPATHSYTMLKYLPTLWPHFILKYTPVPKRSIWTRKAGLV